MGVHEALTGAQRTARYSAAKRAKGLKLRDKTNKFAALLLPSENVKKTLRRERFVLHCPLMFSCLIYILPWAFRGSQRVSPL